MASLGETFDATIIEPSTGGGGVIPAGRYRAAMVKSEWKETKKHDGHLLELIFEIIAGEQKGSRVYGRLNLKNKNADAVRIARSGRRSEHGCAGRRGQ